MARTDKDAWDLASSVGVTATMVASARAAASRRPRPVITDQFAEPLVRAVGVDVLTRFASGEIDSQIIEKDTGVARMVDIFAARAWFFDDFLDQAVHAGLRQVVILASGLDTRAYRLQWPAGTTVYEIDKPEVIAFKTRTLSDIGASPTAALKTVGIDLREDWPAALQDVGFDPTQPTAWVAEGLLIGYLPPVAEVRLLASIFWLCESGSRLAADFGLAAGISHENQQQARLMTKGWRRHGLDLDIANLTYPGAHTDVTAELQDAGWQTTELTIGDLFIAAELPALGNVNDVGSAAAINFVRAALA